MTQKSAWPLTKDGVPDWERAFEHESNGLIAAVMRAPSPLLLKQCTTAIIQQLFTRENDSMHIMKNVIALEAIIPDDQLEAKDPELLSDMRLRIGALMREIKEERIENANKFLRRKAEDMKDRRAST